MTSALMNPTLNMPNQGPFAQMLQYMLHPETQPERALGNNNNNVARVRSSATRPSRARSRKTVTTQATAATPPTATATATVTATTTATTAVAELDASAATNVPQITAAVTATVPFQLPPALFADAEHSGHVETQPDQPPAAATKPRVTGRPRTRSVSADAATGRDKSASRNGRRKKPRVSATLLPPTLIESGSRDTLPLPDITGVSSSDVRKSFKLLRTWQHIPEDFVVLPHLDYSAEQFAMAYLLHMIGKR